MPNYTYELLAETEQLRTAISQEDGSANAVVMLTAVDGEDVTPEDLSNFATHLSGTVDNLKPDTSDVGTDPNAGKILRSLPLQHPWCPQLVVAGAPSITGMDEGGKVTADAVEVSPLLTPLVETFDLYKHWAYAVELRKRKYYLLPNEDVGIVTGTYYPPGYDGVTVTSKGYSAAAEWKRFVSRTQNPLPDTVSANVNSGAKFRTQSGAAPDGTLCPISIQQFLQNQIVEYMWYQVPFRYFMDYTIGGVVYKSYLNRFVNYVNQYEWDNKAPGSMMFLGATPDVYPPMLPDVRDFDQAQEDQWLLCNVKMRFLYTTREGSDIPSSGDRMFLDLNNIPAGHNLQPNFATRKFHYVPTVGPAPGTDRTKWRAPYPSFPIELLWTDPLAIQPDGVI